MLSYHSDPKLKAQALEEMREHQRLDHLEKGIYGFGLDPNHPDFRGCMIGCLGGQNTHYGVFDRFGFPLALCHLFDATFEELPEPAHIAFTTDALEAIPVGVDLDPVVDRLVRWMLADPMHGVRRRVTGSASIQRVIALFERRLAGDEPTAMDWERAYSASGFASAGSGQPGIYQAYRAAEAAARFAVHCNVEDAADAADAAAVAYQFAVPLGKQETTSSTWWRAFAAEMLRLLREAA